MVLPIPPFIGVGITSKLFLIPVDDGVVAMLDHTATKEGGDLCCSSLLEFSIISFSKVGIYNWMLNKISIEQLWNNHNKE